MSSSSKGARWEHKAIRMLEGQQFACMRAGGSLGVFDIIAVGAERVRLVQVKGGKVPYCAPAERAAIAAFPVPVAMFAGRPVVTKELWLFCSKRVRVKGVRVPVTLPPRIIEL